MRLVFQRPIWLDFTAFSLVLTGLIGYVMGFWRLSLSVGMTLKISVLQACISFFQFFLSDSSWVVRNLKEVLFAFRNFLDLASWYKYWYYASGILELMVSTALLIVAMFLWKKKTYAVRTFYIFILLSIAIHVVNISSSLLLSENLGIMKMLLDMPLMLWKLLLLMIVLSANKSIFGMLAKERVQFKELS
ncbi:MAG: hypothetical protein GYA55_02455 [SAR324 cluster bacterium]|uniref:Uncharacterized protein n=1 Tax=SAR324 cluster bacterium TaxID=2024889 RepID=A0A7X9IKI5_9DELT|nr:hypothetical protein [SAR324 cluster bacterium]